MQPPRQAGVAMVQPSEPIRYTLRFPTPASHYVEVEALIPTDGRPSIELTMAVWTPGSYLVREYARHLEEVCARTLDGACLVMHKARKNRWRVQTHGAALVQLAYRVYGREMSVRTNWVEADF